MKSVDAISSLGRLPVQARVHKGELADGAVRLLSRRCVSSLIRRKRARSKGFANTR
jgi:hypothetical protein